MHCSQAEKRNKQDLWPAAVAHSWGVSHRHFPKSIPTRGDSITNMTSHWPSSPCVTMQLSSLFHSGIQSSTNIFSLRCINEGSFHCARQPADRGEGPAPSCRESERCVWGAGCGARLWSAEGVCLGRAAGSCPPSPKTVHSPRGQGF